MLRNGGRKILKGFVFGNWAMTLYHVQKPPQLIAGSGVGLGWGVSGRVYRDGPMWRHDRYKAHTPHVWSRLQGRHNHHLLLPEPAWIPYMFGFELFFYDYNSETFYGSQCGWSLHSVMTPCYDSLLRESQVTVWINLHCPSLQSGKKTQLILLALLGLLPRPCS